MRNIIIIVLCFFTFSCKSTYTRIGSKEANYIPYYLKVYEADSLYIVKDYKRSYKILDSLFKKFEPVNAHIYYEVINYMKLKVILNKRISRKETENWILNYGVTLSRLENDSILNLYYSKDEKLKKDYPKLREKFISSIHLDLREEIVKMIEQDQFYRKKDYQENIDKQEEIDAKNAKRYIEIFNQYGYPSARVIGDYSIDKRMISEDAILLHTNDEERINYFLPKILEFINKGEARPMIYANMYDQFYLYNGEKQYYGSYNSEVDISVMELNRRRKTIGLPNYGYEKWRFKKLYPNEEF
ncbi:MULTISPECIES: hypothetical protein [Flavobacterium]|uniref:Lipoprotein n=1 Tax=Flavobacterium jumunjinense TaxID=998845 RepID=A0ABV5GIP3_9FLAO|nr:MULTISPECIES: hypothetical protein [Flavobacterium]